jgi:hypothetical protein
MENIWRPPTLTHTWSLQYSYRFVMFNASDDKTGRTWRTQRSLPLAFISFVFWCLSLFSID